jgi:hypothetical protein
MKLVKYVADQAWTLAGTGIVLITLSGQTRTWGLWMSGVALVLHLLSYLLPENDDV